MNKYHELITALAAILENPNAQKSYRELEKIYKKHNMHNEAEVIFKLIKDKFNVNSADTD